MAIPRFRGSTAAATNAWLIGMTPPSATPINSRAATSVAKDPATPETNDAPENSSAEVTRMILRRPRKSERRPTNNPAAAQLRESADASPPMAVFDSPSSGWMKGINTLIELRSKKTMPKFTLSSATSVHW
jgi:hypothetical protein